MKLHSWSPLQLALGASVAVHVLLLGGRWIDPLTFSRKFQDTPLEVILVNARSLERPSKANAIAQNNLAGGGEPGQNRASNPLSPSLRSATGEVVEDSKQTQLHILQEQQTLLLAQAKQQLATPLSLNSQAHSAREEKIQREEKRRELLELLAEIERRIQQENSRSKKRYISPATREEAYALYYDKLRRAIETRGTEHFPQAGGKKLYGELTMIVSVNYDGRLLATEIVQSSGNRTLDRQAQAIALNAAPFDIFSLEMRSQADQLHLVSRFKFSRDDTLQATLARP